MKKTDLLILECVEVPRNSKFTTGHFYLAKKVCVVTPGEFIWSVTNDNGYECQLKDKALEKAFGRILGFSEKDALLALYESKMTIDPAYKAMVANEKTHH